MRFGFTRSEVGADVLALMMGRTLGLACLFCLMWKTCRDLMMGIRVPLSRYQYCDPSSHTESRRCFGSILLCLIEHFALSTVSCLLVHGTALEGFGSDSEAAG